METTYFQALGSVFESSWVVLVLEQVPSLPIRQTTAPSVLRFYMLQHSIMQIYIINCSKNAYILLQVLTGEVTHPLKPTEQNNANTADSGVANCVFFKGAP